MLVTLSGAACYWTITKLLLHPTSVNRVYTVTPAKYGNQVKLASYYPPEGVEQLKRLSDITRVPQAAYLREALEDLLKKYAATLRKIAK